MKNNLDKIVIGIVLLVSVVAVVKVLTIRRAKQTPPNL